MSAQHCGERFRLIDLLMTTVVVAFFLLMASCVISNARVNSRRNQCQSNIRQIALALYDKASRARYPNASTATQRTPDREIGLPLVGQVTVDGQDYPAPGVADPTNGGYSWLVRILDGLEEITLDQEIRYLSDKYQKPAFGKDMVRQPGDGSEALHYCRVPMPFLRCPTFAGEYHADEKQEIYQDDYRHPGISSYVCIPGTHFKSKNELEENGVIVSRAASRIGLSMDDVVDGTSRTLLVVETREPNYASWYDGQVNWVTAFLPVHLADFDMNDDSTDQDGDGVPDVISDEWITALNYGPDGDDDTQNVYMQQSPYTKDQSYGGRRWGPSSMHAGGVVLHAFADLHTSAIAGDIDPEIYYALVTRNGAESLSLEPSIRE
jgi:hypothetical protein